MRQVLGSRGVVALLVGTAVVSGAGAVVDAGGERATGSDLAMLEPVAAAMVERRDGDAEPLAEAWRKRSAEDAALRLAEDYSRKGYSVSPELATDIVDAAVRHGIEIDIAFGLIRAESGFKNHATSPVGAVGLTQLMPRTAAWMQPGVSRSALRNPETNLDIGFKYLRYLLDKYEGNEDLALLAYNRGPGTVDRALKRGRNPDNGYARFVRGERNHGHRLFTGRG